MPKIIQVIESQESKGHGETDADPIRFVTRYYTLEGDLLAEHDPWVLEPEAKLEAAEYKAFFDCMSDEFRRRNNDDPNLPINPPAVYAAIVKMWNQAETDDVAALKAQVARYRNVANALHMADKHQLRLNFGFSDADVFILKQFPDSLTINLSYLPEDTGPQ